MGSGREAATTRKLRSQFFARQILLPHSLKRFRGAAPSIMQNAFKLDTPAMCNGIGTTLQPWHCRIREDARVHGDRLAIPHSMQSRRNHSRAPFTRFLLIDVVAIGKR